MIKLKKILFLTIFVILGFTCTAIASPSLPVFLNTYEGGGPYDASDGTNGPYPNGAPYSLVATGIENDLLSTKAASLTGETWIISDTALVPLIDHLTLISKFEYEDDGENSYWEGGENSDNKFIIDPEGAATTGTWKYDSGSS